MEKSSFKQDAYDYIKKNIISGVWLPGTVIDERGISQFLGFSKTPVREAIQRLASENLLVVMPRRGTIVSYISVEDVRALIQARQTIEPTVIKLALHNTDRQRLIDFRTAFSQQCDMTWQDKDLDSDFHLYLAECAHNKYLYQMMESVMLHTMRIRVLSNVKAMYRFEEARNEHNAIIQALLENNEGEAEKAILDHLHQTEKGYKEIFTNQTYFSL